MNKERVLLKDMINLYNALNQHGVAIYGAGKRGEMAIKLLRREGIRIICVSDRRVGIKVEGINTISIDEMKKRDNIRYVLITPVQELPDVERSLADYQIVEFAFINWLCYFFPNKATIKQIEYCRPFNFYESPYSCDYDHVVTGMRDIDLNEERQKNNLLWIGDEARCFYERRKNVQTRYRENGMFCGLDAAVLFAFVRKYSPKRIIEIGSGYSTAIMLDAYESINDDSAKITCIEPNSGRLKSLLRESDKLEIIEQGVQGVTLELFDSLEENDILFIDSSHVARRGSDVVFEYFQVFPRIKEGVLIHIHDIHYPFEYCETWAEQLRAYNEIYILRALLMNNNTYSIEFFNSYMENLYMDLINNAIPDLKNDNAPNGSIWLRKEK